MQNMNLNLALTLAISLFCSSESRADIASSLAELQSAAEEMLGSSTKTSSPKASSKDTRASTAKPSKIKSLRPHAYEIPRAERDEFFSDPRPLLNQVRASQASTGEGFTLHEIERGSVFEKLGLKNGDTVRSLNGKKMNNRLQALSSMIEMRSANNAKLELLRKGKPLTLTYTVR
jgi:general secretion pathway protein C